MDELLKQRIERRLENLPDDKAYQVLDYIEFLESKFGTNEPSTLELIADRVEDTMRAGRVSVSAIKGARDAIGTAGKVMQGLADAGRSVLDEIQQGPSARPTETERKGKDSASPASQTKGEPDDADSA